MGKACHFYNYSAIHRNIFKKLNLLSLGIFLLIAIISRIVLISALSRRPGKKTARPAALAAGRSPKFVNSVLQISELLRLIHVLCKPLGGAAHEASAFLGNP